MTNMTLAIPSDLHKLMKKHKQIRWAEVARHAIREQAEKLEWMDKVLSKSELTEKDTIEIGRLVNKGIARRLGVLDENSN